MVFKACKKHADGTAAENIEGRLTMDFEKMKKAMAELDEDALKEAAGEVMADGGSEALLAFDACREGMEEVGRLYDEGEYFVGDLLFAGEILTETIEILKPGLKSEGKDMGRMIIATVKGDLHDIGKNIVKAMLNAAGFEVLDLGVDVSPEKIIETVEKEGIGIVALSCVLTLGIDEMKKTIEAIKAAGLKEKVHVIIGGAPITEAACAITGADEWAVSPMKTVDTCKKWSIV